MITLGLGGLVFVAMPQIVSHLGDQAVQMMGGAA